MNECRVKRVESRNGDVLFEASSPVLFDSLNWDSYKTYCGYCRDTDIALCGIYVTYSDNQTVLL